jgi:hypothetical protein
MGIPQEEVKKIGENKLFWRKSRLPQRLVKDDPGACSEVQAADAFC